ncbi:hypothetical protein ACNHKD_17300 [Methylocystis sp. JAN1]|uniref:hypothetical protein n=1 Tax=Methylocystis sp. JAN1 TaxID=3397211 RepID=UPI003FA25A01
MRLIVASALLAIVLAFGATLLFLAREEAPKALIQAELAGAKYSYARAYARDESTGAGGLTDHLAFIASFPQFTPLSAKDRAAASHVAITLTPKDDGLDPSERPAKLYARFLAPETLEGPGGLVLRRFEQGSPYDSEELLIAPPDGRSFFARCPKPDAGAPGEACISVFREGELDVEMRYPPALLEHWDALYDGARALIAKMTSRRRKR